MDYSKEQALLNRSKDFLVKFTNANPYSLTEMIECRQDALGLMNAILSYMAERKDAQKESKVKA